MKYEEELKEINKDLGTLWGLMSKYKNVMTDEIKKLAEFENLKIAAKKVYLLENDLTAPDYELSQAVFDLGTLLARLDQPNVKITGPGASTPAPVHRLVGRILSYTEYITEIEWDRKINTGDYSRFSDFNEAVEYVAEIVAEDPPDRFRIMKKEVKSQLLRQTGEFDDDPPNVRDQPGRPSEDRQAPGGDVPRSPASTC